MRPLGMLPLLESGRPQWPSHRVDTICPCHRTSPESHRRPPRRPSLNATASAPTRSPRVRLPAHPRRHHPLALPLPARSAIPHRRWHRRRSRRARPATAASAAPGETHPWYARSVDWSSSTGHGGTAKIEAVRRALAPIGNGSCNTCQTSPNRLSAGPTTTCPEQPQHARHRMTVWLDILNTDRAAVRQDCPWSTGASWRTPAQPAAGTSSRPERADRSRRASDPLTDQWKEQECLRC
jgi:hypothetical protein